MPLVRPNLLILRPVLHNFLLLSWRIAIHDLLHRRRTIHSVRAHRTICTACLTGTIPLICRKLLLYHCGVALRLDLLSDCVNERGGFGTEGRLRCRHARAITSQVVSRQPNPNCTCVAQINQIRINVLGRGKLAVVLQDPWLWLIHTYDVLGSEASFDCHTPK